MAWFSADLRLVALLCSLAAHGRTDEDWINPYDMLNYDAGTKSMRTQPEASDRFCGRRVL
ncbi:hypothetical protein CRUP_020709 [Coryphaenoides rupestris]|nr:hypothetical protein CRUP_020709 [Coryphaenoides rupestris]